MEALTLALIAVGNLYKQQQAFEPEAEFQSFDLQALRDLHNAKDRSPSRLSDRQASFVAQAAS
jgi:hypothetical protein